ncbi:hypothetical protein JCM8547_007462 [Rhodosporidiobolus lusitaniae]
MPSVSNWETAAAAKRDAVEQKLASYDYKLPDVSSKVLDVTSVPLDDVLTPKQLEITTSELDVLLDKLQKGEWKAVEVTEAFCYRAVIAHSLVNCLNEVFFEKALARAKELDEVFKTSGPVGALHGLPISLKNQISVEGEDTNMGYTGWIGRVAKQDSVLAASLRKQGAILYCITNVPQSLMSSETKNNIYGLTVNPFNRNISCGGSSGGEGALIGFRGSPAGFGSDIGGSVRIPAAYNGLYGFRGSYNRLPYGGSVNSCEGLEAVSSVLGPLTVSMSGLSTLVKAVLASEPWRADPLCQHIPWRDELYHLAEHGGEGAQLCFGLLKDNGLVKPCPPYERAMEMTRKALEAKGHKVVEWTFPKAGEMMNILNAIYTADGGADIDAACALSGEPRLFNMFEGDEKLPHLSTYEYWQLCSKRRTFLTAQLAAWEATSSLTGTGRPFDALITPIAPYPSFAHGTAQDISYTGLSNLNDFPTAVVPVTRVDPSLDASYPRQEYHDYDPLNTGTSFDRVNWERYDPEFFKNCPISLQVLGRKGEDEAVIRMTEVVDEALKSQKV